MSNNKESWVQMLSKAMERRGDTLTNIIASTPSVESLEMNTPFDNGYGHANGCPFTVWTQNYVYFPCEYDGAEWVDSVDRNPNGVATAHVGAG